MTSRFGFSSTLLIIVLSSSILLMACPTKPIVPVDPKAVVDAFLAARNSGDTEAALALVDG